MKLIGTDCSGECLFCIYSGACLAGHGDDDYYEASKNVLIARLQEYERRFNKFESIDYRKNPNQVAGIIENIQKLRKHLGLKDFTPNEELLNSFIIFQLDDVMEYEYCGGCKMRFGSKRFAQISHSVKDGFDVHIICERCFKKISGGK